MIVVDIEVDDDLWRAVMREKFGPGYVCINCFASRADEKLIDWAQNVKLTAISFAAQMQVQYDAAAAARAFESGFTSESATQAQVEAGDWIDWKGDSFSGPVPPPLVSLRFRDGSEHDNCNPFDYTWRDRGAPDDIVAYQAPTPVPTTAKQTEACAAAAREALTEERLAGTATPQLADDKTHER